MSEHLRVVVTGSRHWTDEALIQRELSDLAGDAPLYLGHGNARGADRMAAKAARRLGFPVQPYNVRRELDGCWPAAGHRRNERMLDAHRPDFVIAFRAPGKSSGTDGCVKAARRRGIKVKVVEERQ